MLLTQSFPCDPRTLHSLEPLPSLDPTPQTPFHHCMHPLPTATTTPVPRPASLSTHLRPQCLQLLDGVVCRVLVHLLRQVVVFRLLVCQLGLHRRPQETRHTQHAHRHSVLTCEGPCGWLTSAGVRGALPGPSSRRIPAGSGWVGALGRCSCSQGAPAPGHTWGCADTGATLNLLYCC